MPKLVLALWLMTWSGAVRAEAPDAHELARALSADRLGLGAGEATLAMELRDKAGRIVSRTIRARTAIGDGVRKMRLTFLEPADQRGIELLVVDGRGGPPLQYLWLPRAAELRRVAASERGGRFQGSDFSFADFEDRDLSKASMAVTGEETVGGLAAWRIDITQAPGGAAGDWSRVTAWIAKEARVPLRVQFFRGEALARQLDVKRLQSSQGRLVPTSLEMSDPARGTRTTLRILELEPAARFPDAIFAPEALGR